MGIEDYRKSHIGKGESYHNQFIKNPYRSTIWELEQVILSKIIFEKFDNNPIPNYLDFACGTGRILQFIENRSVNSTGVDISGSMLKEAESNTKSAKLIETDITQNDVLNNEKYNLITAFRFFPNAQDDLRIQVTKVLTKHLKKDGYFVFNNHMNANSLKYRIKRFVTKTKKLSQGLSEDEVKNLLIGAGLQIITKYHIGLLPFNENKPILKKKQLKVIESWLMMLNSKFICNLSQNIIYVCKKK